MSKRAKNFHLCRGCDPRRNLRRASAQFCGAPSPGLHRACRRGSWNQGRSVVLHAVGLNAPGHIVPALHALKPRATFNHLPVNVIVQRILVLLDEIILAPEIGSVSDGERYKYWRLGSSDRTI